MGGLRLLRACRVNADCARGARNPHFAGHRCSTDLYWLPSSRNSIVFSSFTVKASLTSKSVPPLALQVAFALMTLPSTCLSPNVHGPKLESTCFSPILTSFLASSLPSPLHCTFCVKVPSSAASSAAQAVEVIGAAAPIAMSPMPKSLEARMSLVPFRVIWGAARQTAQEYGCGVMSSSSLPATV